MKGGQKFTISLLRAVVFRSPPIAAWPLGRLRPHTFSGSHAIHIAAVPLCHIIFSAPFSSNSSPRTEYAYHRRQAHQRYLLHNCVVRCSSPTEERERPSHRSSSHLYDATSSTGTLKRRHFRSAWYRTRHLLPRTSYAVPLSLFALPPILLPTFATFLLKRVERLVLGISAPPTAQDIMPNMERGPLSPPSTERPRAHSRGISIRSDNSGSKKDWESARDKERRDSFWKGTSKANPNAAINEIQPGGLSPSVLPDSALSLICCVVRQLGGACFSTVRGPSTTRCTRMARRLVRSRCIPLTVIPI